MFYANMRVKLKSIQNSKITLLLCSLNLAYLQFITLCESGSDQIFFNNIRKLVSETGAVVFLFWLAYLQVKFPHIYFLRLISFSFTCKFTFETRKSNCKSLKRTKRVLEVQTECVL